MTRSRVGWTLLAALSTVGCHEAVDCIQDDPPELIITARSTADGVLLDGLSGFVQDNRYARDLICFADGDHDKCYGNATSQPVKVHVERNGFLPWDTASVHLEWTGGDCPRPVAKYIEVAMTPESDT